jgi:hypothetical protein
MPADDSLVYVESVDANSVAGETPLEHVRASEAIASERGHLAEALVRTAAGRVVTPAEFSDGAFDVAVRSRRAVAARRLEASHWGLPAGSDYLVSHWPGVQGQDFENFHRLEMPAWRYVYAGAESDDWGERANPVGMFGDVSDLRFTADETSVVALHWNRDPLNSVSSLFVHDLNKGQQRLLTRLPDSATASHGELSISPDGRYAIAGSPVPELVDLQTGHCAGFGSRHGLRAATWYPTAGPSCVLGVTGGHDDPPWTLVVLDLATFEAEHLADLPRRADGLQVAGDGAMAARMRPEGDTGWFDELVVSTDDGRNFEPVAPLRGASGWRRRGTRPRWLEVRPLEAAPVVLLPEFEEFLRAVPPDNDANPGEIRWVLDKVAGLIAQRVSRLRERPRAADLLLDQLHILITLPMLFDPEMIGGLASEVLTEWQAAANTRAGRLLVDAIIAVIAHRLELPITISFGGR